MTTSAPVEADELTKDQALAKMRAAVTRTNRPADRTKADPMTVGELLDV